MIPPILSQLLFFFKTLLWCFLLGFDPINAQGGTEPIVVQWGTPEYESDTYVRVPLCVLINSEWKLTGPFLKGDTLNSPPTLKWDKSTNIADVQIFWPHGELLQQQGQTSHVYKKSFSVILHVFLKDRAASELNVEFKGLACSDLCRVIKTPLSLKLNPPAQSVGKFWQMLSFAFLGGIILNIMPCVLPVLGLKLKGLASVYPFLLRKMFLLTSIGIIAGFWFLAGLTISLKIFFQQQMRWGMQLQNVYFLLTLCIIMVISSYSLLGMFHLNTPRWAARFLPKSYRTSFGAFFSGLFAVLLATPCSAPLLGPALGYFLSGTYLEIFLSFTLVAFGFALPYILGIIFPVHKLLPKPGQWMFVMEKTIGVLFFGTAVWLVWWPLGSFLSESFQKIALGFLLVIGIVPFIHKKIREFSLWIRSILLFVVPSAAGVGLCILPFFNQKVQEISMIDGQIHWLPWSAELMEKTLRAGRVVVIDITARGCLLCEVNKSVFKEPGMQELLTSSKIVCLRADYSKASDDITALLKRFSRAGIPCNIILSKDYPQGIVLSEALSSQEIEKCIKFLYTLSGKSSSDKQKPVFDDSPKPSDKS